MQYLPTRLLSLKSLLGKRSKPEIPLYTRNTKAVISQGQLSQHKPVEDVYGDKQKYLSMKNYKKVPSKSSNLPLIRQELQFDSHFESGNLKSAYKYKEKEYILLLSSDTETDDYSYWYYFKVTCHVPGDFRFHIVNISRDEAMIKEGMRPAVWTQETDWTRGGFDVSFAETTSVYSYLPEGRYYTLSFSYTFTSSSDVFFAYSYPYTYKDLQRMLRMYHSSFLKTLPICTSLLGNLCECLVISENSPSKAIVLTGRVHPGETHSSYIMHGVIEFLLAHSEEAKELRKLYVFYIFPMLNPDGVRHGNCRCSALGVDLNRRWQKPSKTMHPTIFFTKQFISQIPEDIVLFCDFHGHSKKKDVFMYGCNPNNAMPSIMNKICSHFSLENTHFVVDKNKESTARVVMNRERKIKESFTLECSMFGSNKKEFTIQCLKEIGHSFAKACLRLHNNGKLPGKRSKSCFKAGKNSVKNNVKQKAHQMSVYDMSLRVDFMDESKKVLTENAIFAKKLSCNILRIKRIKNGLPNKRKFKLPYIN